MSMLIVCVILLVILDRYDKPTKKKCPVQTNEILKKLLK